MQKLPFIIVCRLELLEAGARDPSDFISWQNKMRKQDMDTELAEIERRRLEGKLSHEDAILARQNLIEVYELCLFRMMGRC